MTEEQYLWFGQGKSMIGRADGFMRFPAEYVSAVNACLAAWGFGDADGPHPTVAINARFINDLGATAGASSSSYFSHSLTPGTCSSPQLFDELPQDNASAFVMVPDLENERPPFNTSKFDGLLAHELGHTLALKHGNGLDDEPCNGVWDGSCDPAEATGEVEGAPCSGSLMCGFGLSSEVLTPLQRERMRWVAHRTVHSRDLADSEGCTGAVPEDAPGGQGGQGGQGGGGGQGPGGNVEGSCGCVVGASSRAASSAGAFLGGLWALLVLRRGRRNQRAR